MTSPDALARLEAVARLCGQTIDTSFRDSGTGEEIIENTLQLQHDLRALLAERKALVEALERAKDAAEDMIDMANEMAESVGSAVEGDCPGSAEVCAEGLCESGCLVARVSLARDGIRRAAAVLGGGEKT